MTSLNSTLPPTGADALVSSLADAGVRFCFSNPGTSELDLVLALERQDRIRNVPVVFEGVASGAADGYARLTGQPAATLLHLAPGWHNASANLHNATKAASPIINLVGDQASHHRHRQTPLAADLPALVAPSSIWWSRVDAADDMARLAIEAARQAVNREGVSTLIIAADAAWTACAQSAAITGDAHAAAKTSDTTGVPTCVQTLAAVLDAVQAARHPALLVGGSGLHADGLAACARLQARGIRILSEHFPARQARGGGHFNPERLQYFTENARMQLSGCDLLIAIGTPLPFGTFAYPNRPDTHLPDGCEGLFSDVSPSKAGKFLQALADACEAAPARSDRGKVGSPPPLPQGAISPATLGQSLTRHMPEGAIVSDDSVTASGFLLASTLDARQHDWLVITGGALGQGLPVAIGAALACPGRRVICVTGDGAFLYTNQALWTIAREELDITVVVLSNRSYEILKFELSRMPGSPVEPRPLRALSLAPPAVDHVALAAAFGVPGILVDDAAKLDAALSEALSTPGPKLIDALVG